MLVIIIFFPNITYGKQLLFRGVQQLQTPIATYKQHRHSSDVHKVFFSEIFKSSRSKRKQKVSLMDSSVFKNIKACATDASTKTEYIVEENALLFIINIQICLMGKGYNISGI